MQLPLLLPLLVACLVSVGLYLRRRNRKPLPPGPPRWPVIGNALQMPKGTECLWFKYTEWGNKYGEVVYLNVFGRSIVVLNSAKAAFDLLQKRSSYYSDRPTLPMAGELVGWDRALSLTHYNEDFRQRRRLMHQIFSPQSAQRFWPVEEQHATRFLSRLLDTPEKLDDHIRLMTGAVVLRISHGYAVSETAEDPFIAHAERTMVGFSKSTAPGAFMVDSLPFLKHVPLWFPGAAFRRKAAQWRDDLTHLCDSGYQYAKDQMAKGTALPSFASEYLEQATTPEIESRVKWTASSIYSGGADTTVSQIRTFFLAMCTRPDVQVAAQAELDTVIGQDRLPKMSDRPSLPYVDAVVKEVLRWMPAVPSGVPHRVEREDEYNGYRIPSGSIVIANIWGITHDPAFFPDPHSFRPERFLGKDKKDGPYADPYADPYQLSFGFGRRICPGQNLAEPSVFLAVAMTLATFTISKARDAQGKVIEPELAWTPGTICHVKDFRCELKPRSQRAIDLVRHSVSDEKI